jgi:tetratricopeptide (TPR) repeat protein
MRERGGGQGVGRVISLRVPVAPRRAEPPAPAPPSDRPALRLAVSRGTLGIELDAPFAMAPLEVMALSLGLPGVRFPVDLSGGVARFRHRRGALDHLAVELGAADLSAWVGPRLRGLLGERTPEVTLAPFDEGVMAGMRAGAAALAFDVLVAPMDGDLRLIPERARGIGLGSPPHVLAMRALAAACAPFGKAVGGAIVLAGAAAQVVRHLMPAAGARAPSAGGVRWEAPVLGEGSLRLRLEASRDAAPPALADRSLRALELAELAGAADDAAYAGDLEAARRLYLGVLERAPRHPEASQRLAWIDAVVGDRAEGALGTIVDAMPAAFAGVLGGALLAAVGDRDGALVAYTRGAQSEPYGPLAALTWLEAARLATALDVRLDALNQAVARAPALEAARWARLEARLDVADLRGARADAEHLEAAARGAEARHAVWRAAAAAFLARGHVAEASALFERALRYAPEDVEAVLGLARSLRAAGQGRRAVDLFARAVALGARAGAPAHEASIELARGLAEVAGDRPAAIARVRAVPPGLASSCAARFLEGRWRAELGDLAGAALSFGRLRDAVELAAPPDPDGVAAMLVEAAEIEERERVDLHAAQRSLGLALRLRPHDRRIAATFRRVATLVAAAARPAPAPPPQAEPEPPEPESAPPELEAARTDVPPPLVDEEEHSEEEHSEEEHSEADDERLVQQLTDRLRGDPGDHRSAMELAGALGRLGRDMDLLALLSARMEEGDEDERREVAPLRREVLLRLAVEARAAGRDSEGELYEMMAAGDAE